MKKIYLDNAATTRVLEDSAKLAMDVMTKDYGNPSSIHNKGFEAEKLLREARAHIAKCIGADDSNIYFTSGATEANNLAILGGIRANKRIGKHIITSKIEHSSVKNVIKYLEKEEGYEVTYLNNDEYGVIDINELMNSIQPDTVLVSIMYVNNETGIIQPIEEIGNIISRINDKTLFHIDAVQAVGKLPLNLRRTHIDLLSSSAHKFHGPKGVGFLYVKKNTKINSIVFGGGQENGLRSGTENVPYILAMSHSLNEANKCLSDSFEHVDKLKKAFVEGIEDIEDIRVNGYKEDSSSPYILNISFKGVRSEVLIHALEDKGIYASAGSACSSHSKVKSGTLYAMGLSDAYVDSSVRFSFNRFMKEYEIKTATKAIKELVPILRQYQRK